jgi:hypothetical protein
VRQGWDDVIWNANECELSYLHIHFVKGNTSDLVPRPTRLFCYTELGTDTNLETLTLFAWPPTALPLGRLAVVRKWLWFGASYLRIVFWLGLGLGYIIVSCRHDRICTVT